ncbi:MAG: thioredoxin family protein [Opitutaceae bacterium]
MNRLLKTSLIAAATFGLAAFAQAAAVVGKPAPDFTLKDSKGKNHSLADYEGKLVVLEWVNHGCPYVKKHYNSKNIPNLQETYTNDGVVWLTICSSAPGDQGHGTPAEWEAMIKKHDMNSTAVLLDETGTVGKAYGAKTTPHMYVIDKKGMLRYNGAIDSKATTDIADLETADNYVKLAIAAIEEGKPVGETTTRPYGCGIKYSQDT